MDEPTAIVVGVGAEQGVGGAVFLEKNQTISQAKGRAARPGLLGEAENIAIESPVFVQASDPHRDS